MSMWVPRRNHDPSRPEFMDRPDSDPKLLADDLHNLRVINRRFGALKAIEIGTRPLLDRIEPGGTIEILDLGTGSADVPVHLAGLLKREGRAVRVDAVDKNPIMVEVALGTASAHPEITVREMDLLSVGYPDRSFDIVFCSSVIHHFSRRDAVRILREMNRLSRIGFVVSDLYRSRPGAWAAWLYGHLSTTNPITRHDAYVSMLRGFTQDELTSMADEAGIRSYIIERLAFLRLIMTAVHT